jgi:hypothetical protein
MFAHSEGAESSKEHGRVVDSFRCRRSFDVRYRCSDEQSTPLLVVHASQSITGILQRRLLRETAAVLFRIGPDLDNPPRSRPVGGLLFAPLEIAGDAAACPGRLGRPRGHLCWHGHFSNLSVRTIDPLRHKERVRGNSIPVRTNTMTMKADFRRNGLSASRRKVWSANTVPPGTLLCRNFGLR